MKKSNYKPIKSKLITLAIIGIFLLSGYNIQRVQAHEYYKIMLRIQTVNPAMINDSQIVENTNRMNQIFAQCRIKFNIILIVRNINGDANNITGRQNLRNMMSTAISLPPFSGNGAGVTITDGVDNDTNTLGITVVGGHTSIIVDDGQSGDTWAHEMAHGMGLKHNGNDTNGDGKDDKFDPDGDGNYDTLSDKRNIMWPYTSTNTGSAFSESQCEELQKKAKEIGTTTLNADQAAAANRTLIQKVFNFYADKADEYGIGEKIDLLSGTISSVQPFSRVSIQWVVDTVYSPSDNVAVDFMVGIDVDNNASTGNMYEPFTGNLPGIDILLSTSIFSGSFYDPSNYYITITNYTALENGGDISGIVSPSLLNESSTSLGNEVPIDPMPAYSLLEITINMSDLGIVSTNANAVMAFSDGIFEDAVNFTLNLKPLSVPQIHVNSQSVDTNDTLLIQGESFTPNSNIDIIFADSNITSVMSNSTGGLSTSIIIPDLPTGTYYLEAIDEDLNLGFLVIDVTHVSLPTSEPSSSNSESIPPSQNPSSSIPSETESNSSRENGLNVQGIGLAFIVMAMFIFWKRNEVKSKFKLK